MIVVGLGGWMQQVSYHSQLSIIIYQLSIYYEENPSRLNCHSGFYHSFFCLFFSGWYWRSYFVSARYGGWSGSRSRSSGISWTYRGTYPLDKFSFWRYAYLPDVSELWFYQTAEVDRKHLSFVSSALCSVDFHYDAWVLYPFAGIWAICLAVCFRRNHLGLLFLFLYPDIGRAYMEICHIGLYSAYDCRYCAGLSEKISVGRNYNGSVHRASDSVEPYSDELLLHVRHPVFCRSLLWGCL